MSTKRQNQTALTSDNRRRQREDSSSSPSHQQPHHVMTQPVFLQKIFPFVAKRMSTPLLFNSVSSSWSETIQHYSGAEICWRAFMAQSESHRDEGCRVLGKSLLRGSDYCYNDSRFICFLRWVIPTLLDTIFTAPAYARAMINQHFQDSYILNIMYAFSERGVLSETLFEKLFRHIERVSGADKLKSLLVEAPKIRSVCHSEQESVSRHYFETLERLGFTDWGRLFTLDWFETFETMPSLNIFRIVMDKCKQVGGDFVRWILGISQLCRPMNPIKLHGHNMTLTLLQLVTLRETLAAEFTQFVVDIIKSIDENGTLLKKLLGLDEKTGVNNVLLLACSLETCTPDLLHVLFDAIESCSGKEGLVRQLKIKGTFENTHHYEPPEPVVLPKSALVVAAMQGSAACVQTIIGKCRELGGDQFVREQLELTSQEDDCAFVHSFYPEVNFEKIQIFIPTMQNIGLEFLKQQFQLKAPDGKNVFLALCSSSAENIKFILNFFKDSSFTDDEIRAHLELRDQNTLNPLMVAAFYSWKDPSEIISKVNSLVDEITRIQSNTNNNNRNPTNVNLLHQLLNERSSSGLTPLMYAIESDASLEIVKRFIELFKDSSPLKNEDGVVSDEELRKHIGPLKPLPESLHGTPTSAFHVACSWSSSAEVFDFLLGIYENFDDNNTSLKRILLRISKDTQGALGLVLQNRSMKHEDKKKSAQKITSCLVKFGFFKDQYEQLKWDKDRLAEFGIDNRLPVQTQLARERKAHSETKQALNKTKRKLSVLANEKQAHKETKKKLAEALRRVAKLEAQNKIVK